MYSSVNMNEKQAEIELELMKIRRRKTDKDRSQAFTEANDGFDDEFEDDTPGARAKSALWKTSTVGMALATIGANVFSVISFAGLTNMIACGVASLTSSVIAVRSVIMQDENSEYLDLSGGW